MAAKKKPAPAEKAPKKTPRALGVEVVDVSALKPHPRNYRTHPPDQLAHLVASIRAHGFYRPVVVARDWTILAGHGVVEACRHEGIAQVPVTRLPVAPDDPRAMRLLAGDNEIGRGASVDDRLLTEVLKELAHEQDGLLGTGYDAMQLAALAFTTRPLGEMASFDAAAEWTGMPGFDPGSPRFNLVVQFRSKEDRDAFIEQTKLQVTLKNEKRGGTWSTWWPTRENEDTDALRWEEG